MPREEEAAVAPPRERAQASLIVRGPMEAKMVHLDMTPRGPVTLTAVAAAAETRTIIRIVGAVTVVGLTAPAVILSSMFRETMPKGFSLPGRLILVPGRRDCGGRAERRLSWGGEVVCAVSTVVPCLSASECVYDSKPTSTLLRWFVM